MLRKHSVLLLLMWLLPLPVRAAAGWGGPVVYGGLVVVVLGAAAGGFVRWRWRRRSLVWEDRQQRLSAQLAAERQRAHQLAEALENKGRDLTNFALDIERKNQFAAELVARLRALRDAPPARLPARIDEVLQFATGNAHLNELLEAVQENIAEVNHEFHRKLSERFPALSANDRLIAGLLRLNMSGKEIATARGISVASAKMARYRLRKKLGLTAETDVVAFLQDI